MSGFGRVSHGCEASKPHVQGAGLGFRRELIDELKLRVPQCIDFFEIAPENWLRLGGALARDLSIFTERYPFVCHGLSLSIGGPTALNEGLIKDIGSFMAQNRITLYTEHLAYCSDDGYLYDLLPIPFTEEAVRYVVDRVCRVQDILGQKIALENTSYYAALPDSTMTEFDFLTAVVESADCLIHLDVNNVYVNSVNHNYDPRAFIRFLPSKRIVYLHIAGHDKVADDLLVDTHGTPVINPVWDLLAYAYSVHGVHPTLLERDSRMPSLAHLEKEIMHIAHIQAMSTSGHAARTP